MSLTSLPKLNLRSLILALAVFSVLITLGNSFYATYKVQHALLINNTLEANRVYAAKLAEMTDAFLKSAQDQLAYSASLLGSQMHNKSALMDEVRRLNQQSDSFNSVVIVDANAVIVATSPETLQVKGFTLSSPGAQQSIDAKKPLITDPFISPAGNYIISLSHPIFNDNGHYLGYIAGTIYLQQDNILGSILGKHYYQDGSYLYVVDRHKTLIYHPDAHRIGQRVANNLAIDEVTAGTEHSHTAINSRGIEMLAGFAPVTRSGWGVVAQRPKQATLAGLDGHIINVFIKSMPLVLFTLAGIWLSATFISLPLWQLAKGARLMDKKEIQQSISGIPSWYFEAAQLKRAILKGMGLLNDKISQLHNDSHTDAMTGLLNRRGMQQVLDDYREERQPFAIITLDIDHFKRVNDTHGHDIGDKVIQALARLMRDHARKGDALCRSGGEEFMIFLPGLDLTLALDIAERLRLQVAGFEMPTAGFITISLGIAHWPGPALTINEALKQADKALYLAKQQGRNRSLITESV
ncbi:sensor domain-containing diguanylate cyclase [uncultured Oceanisphaera sp.]|uniref:sensor domain-containing diguanylate cyclase n=1 Tax=uncultured Oceanisphaera sp. TaxID=353858 RepID=UPI0026274A35|nr:sensor domain-containing diguanylate cyclase [uncultured Oceanisphaera sp.]